MGANLSSNPISNEHEQCRNMLFNATKQDDVFAFSHFYSLLLNFHDSHDPEKGIHGAYDIDFLNWIFHNALLNKSRNILDYFAKNELLHFIPLTEQLLEYLDFYPDCNIVYWLIEHGASVDDTVMKKMYNCFDHTIIQKLEVLQKRQKPNVDPVGSMEPGVEIPEDNKINEITVTQKASDNEPKFPARLESLELANGDGINIPVSINQDLVIFSELE